MGVKLLMQMMKMIVMLMFTKGAFAQDHTNRSLALPGCEERCGSLVVPYPFGIGPNCAASKLMGIHCDISFNPPKAFSSVLSYFNVDRKRPDYEESKALEVVKISVEAGTIQINYPITKDCINTSYNTPVLNLLWPFTFSNIENRFTAMGCDYLALFFSAKSTNSTSLEREDSEQVVVGGCMPMCNSLVEKDNNCFGLNCCQIQFPPSLGLILTTLSNASSPYAGSGPSGCTTGPRYAFIVEQSWFKNLKDIYSLQTMETVPAVLDWTAGSDCRSFTNDTLCGVHAFCTNQSLCSCEEDTKEILTCQMDVKISMSVHSNQEALTKEKDAIIFVPIPQETTLAHAKMGGSLLTIISA
ncbi:wall-associated receptor kinase 4-like [Apium graveolens]|uniref:wall-associated receptor kinase 4-like n=1 Tax=Apium graveolens TaxID=4045 RepID=UPI003D7A8FA4